MKNSIMHDLIEIYDAQDDVSAKHITEKYGLYNYDSLFDKVIADVDSLDDFIYGTVDN